MQNQTQQPLRITSPDQLDALGAVFLGEFATAKSDRRQTEQRWLTDLRQYRGRYEPEEEAKMDPNRSRTFVRKTRIKVRTVTARMMDLLFPANHERNYGVKPTPKPSISRQQRAEIKALLKQALQKEPSQADIDEAIRQAVADAAGKMALTIEDQLAEAKYRDIARKCIRSGNLYGTGIIKAPLVQIKERMRNVFDDASGKWTVQSMRTAMPFISYVPVWRWYPDMSATQIDDCLYVYEHHIFGRHQLMQLAGRKSFDSAAIIEHIKTNPHGLTETQDYEDDLRSVGERDELTDVDLGRYDLLERWGWITAEQLSACGIEVPDEQMHEAFFGNVFILPTGKVIRASFRPPVNGMLYPYHLYNFDYDETSILCDGLAALMRDDQKNLNAATRQTLDNAAATAGPMMEANIRLLPTTERFTDFRPFKVLWRTGDEPQAPAIRVHQVDSRVAELSNIAKMFDENADETSGIPRYLSGENAVQGAAGTAKGLSMLMGNTAIVLKDQVIAYDEGITNPVISGLCKWNMQYNPDESIKGDYDVIATASSSLVAKEVRAQQLTEFATTSANNPNEQPFIKWHKLTQERAAALDLKDVVKTEEEVNGEQNTDAAKMQQQLMQTQQRLAMAELEARANKTMAEAQRILADAERIRADTLDKKVRAAYSAMQAGGVIAANPSIAEVGDDILRSSGWVDATPEQGTPVPQGDPRPAPSGGPQPASPHVGQNAGIETARIEQ